MAMAQGIHWNRGYINAWSVEDTASFLREELALSNDAGLRVNHVNGKKLAALVDGHDNGHARILLPVDQVRICAIVTSESRQRCNCNKKNLLICSSCSRNRFRSSATVVLT